MFVKRTSAERRRRGEVLTTKCKITNEMRLISNNTDADKYNHLITTSAYILYVWMYGRIDVWTYRCMDV